MHCLLDTTERQGQIHTQMAGAMEHPSILNRNADFPGCPLHMLNITFMKLAPLGAVKEK